jgi:hypothetical protein
MNTAAPRKGQAVTVWRTSSMTVNRQFSDIGADKIVAQALSLTHAIATG